MILVVTGGIGSGKSEVCRILRERGLTAQYNADSRVKSLYHENPALLEGLETALGVVLRDDKGMFMPGKLAELIFSDPKALEVVESRVFPVLMDDFETFAHEHPDSPAIVFESATILEKPYFEGFGDRVILVDAPYDVRLERACSRDGLSREHVRTRMANQKLMNLLSEGHTDSRIGAVIMNDAGLEELEDRTDKILKQIL